MLQNNLSIPPQPSQSQPTGQKQCSPLLNQAGWVKGVRVIKICPCVSLCDYICPKGWKSYQKNEKKNDEFMKSNLKSLVDELFIK